MGDVWEMCGRCDRLPAAYCKKLTPLPSLLTCRKLTCSRRAVSAAHQPPEDLFELSSDPIEVNED